MFRDEHGRLIEFSEDGQNRREISDSLFEKKVYSSGSPVAVGEADVSLFPQGGAFDTESFTNILPQIREYADGALPDEVVYQDLERLVNSYNDQKRLNPAQARRLLIDQFPDIEGEGARYQAGLRAMNNASDLLTEIEEVRGSGQLNPRSQADERVGRMRPMPSDAEFADANANIERLNTEIADAEIIKQNAQYVLDKVMEGQEQYGFDYRPEIRFDQRERLAQIEGNENNPLSDLAYRLKNEGVSAGDSETIRAVLTEVDDILSEKKKELAFNKSVFAGPEDVSVSDEMAQGFALSRVQTSSSTAKS